MSLHDERWTADARTVARKVFASKFRFYVWIRAGNCLASLCEDYLRSGAIDGQAYHACISVAARVQRGEIFPDTGIYYQAVIA